jgi:hypothetical protein
MKRLRLRSTTVAILVGLTGTALAGTLADTDTEVVVQTIRAQIAGTSTQNAKISGTRLTFSLKTKLASDQKAKLRVVGTKSQKIRIRSTRSKTVIGASIVKGRAVEIGITPLLKGVRGTVVLSITDGNGRLPAIQRGSRRPQIVITRVRSVPTPVPPTPTPPPPAGDADEHPR